MTSDLQINSTHVVLLQNSIPFSVTAVLANRQQQTNASHTLRADRVCGCLTWLRREPHMPQTQMACLPVRLKTLNMIYKGACPSSDHTTRNMRLVTIGCAGLARQFGLVLQAKTRGSYGTRSGSVQVACCTCTAKFYNMLNLGSAQCSSCFRRCHDKLIAALTALAYSSY